MAAITGGDAIRAFLSRNHRIWLEALPPYAPELNPDEGVWNQMRTAMANGRPDNPEDLAQTVQIVLNELGGSQAKLRWCFHQSELPLFLL
jgi:transposase